MTSDRRTYYVRRKRIRHGWLRTGFTRVRGSRQAEREAQAWRNDGWTTDIETSTTAIRAEVRAWERAAQGHPGTVAVPAPTDPVQLLSDELSIAVSGAIYAKLTAQQIRDEFNGVLAALGVE